MKIERIPPNLIPHIRGQFERALPILFTGAGFSLSAKNIEGDSIPSVGLLKKNLWSLCFPSETYDDTTSLHDLYEHARIRHPTDLLRLLTSKLTVDSKSLPNFYSTIFSMPWGRYYTLNIDDLAEAASRTFDLPRPIDPVSATTSPTIQVSSGNTARALQAVHLNGMLSDIPDHTTFSATQYGERLARPETWYVLLVAEMLSRSVVFIGTTLDEPPLWQHLALRGSRGNRSMAELRPRSYLVTPVLDRARQALLAEYNVTWVPMTAEEFAEEVLAQCGESARKGLELLASVSDDPHKPKSIPEIAALATNPLRATDFFLGEEPAWADLQSGRAVSRECDDKIWNVTYSAYNRPDSRGIVAITGTACSGKSTSLMRCCLRLNSGGIRIGWLDRYTDLTPRDIRKAMSAIDSPKVLAIDDADIFGAELASFIREITLENQTLILLGIRSGRIDRCLNQSRLEGVCLAEIAMPPLEDPDISGILDALEKENRLGILKGLTRPEQEKAFREKAGRQLLVAMYEATSGRRFEEKVMEELLELEPNEAVIYSLVAVAYAFRFTLSRDEILIASGDRNNLTLNTIEQLAKRHIIRPTPDGSAFQARHRFIAETIRDELQKQGRLLDILGGLALVAASKAHPSLPRNSRPWRLLRAITNHDFLMRSVGLEPARNLYGRLEQPREWDYHFWLQRGSLEVEFGELPLAQNFLGQARSLAADDPLVETEWAYLLFRQAIESPGNPDSDARATEALSILDDLIRRRGITDSYPFHVLGSQGLGWVRRGIHGRDKKAEFIKNLLKRLELGVSKHPRTSDLKDLKRDLEAELLRLTVI
ncbi:MAG TPA: SIR2 family protein [Thermoanaerobaculia bacterium]|nr:SIR2 family protein [Thermoanaerobaculia bacterium]